MISKVSVIFGAPTALAVKVQVKVVKNDVQNTVKCHNLRKYYSRPL